MQYTTETLGAWIIHHGQKIKLDVNGASEFPVIDEVAKLASLLIKLGETDQTTLSKKEVEAIAKTLSLNPNYELNGLLSILEKSHFIDVAENGISVIGVTTRAALNYAAELFEKKEYEPYEKASIDLAELTSISPIYEKEAMEKIADENHFSKKDVTDFFNRVEDIGFVDKENDGDEALLFNGNLFRRDCVKKCGRVMESLSKDEQEKMNVLNERLSKYGCLSYDIIEKDVSKNLLDKLIAAGLYDLNRVINEKGTFTYITSPSAFHKFVNPMVDDCFDMAKALVAALTYGMNMRSSSQGRICHINLLLKKLINGYEVGPATAIGKDYRILEVNRVVKLRQETNVSSDLFFMRLLKREVGELALQVLSNGNANEGSLSLFSSSISDYIGPERNRICLRKNQNTLSKRATLDVLEALRGGKI